MTSHHYSYDEYLAYERDRDEARIRRRRDRGDGRRLAPAQCDCYQLIPSLQEYVLVSRTALRVESYRRLASGTREYRDPREGVVSLISGATLDLTRLYGDLPD
jgi:hypothetical protein